MTSSFRIAYLVCENENDGLVNRRRGEVGRSNALAVSEKCLRWKEGGKGRRVFMQRQQEKGGKGDNMNEEEEIYASERLPEEKRAELVVCEAGDVDEEVAVGRA
jgi:hypothetical protein